MRSVSNSSRRHGLGRDGVALPMALLALVAVSVLVTAGFLTSSTELSLSFAHRDGVRSLYQADGAVQAYIAETNLGLEPVADLEYIAPSAAEGVRINVTRVASFPTQRQAPPANAGPDIVYSVQATPERGGRSVLSLAQVETQQFRPNINAGATFGQDLNVQGSVTISNKATVGTCDQPDADAAIVFDKDSGLTTGGNAATIEGKVDTTSHTRQQLMGYTLDGIDIRTLANNAEIKFGFDGHDPFDSSLRVNVDRQDLRYNWGCPAGMGLGCSSSTHAQRMPTVAIDAGTTDVKINGDYGQGMLIILGGANTVEFAGNFSYRGIILVEGSVKITGTPYFEGALIAAGEGDIQIDNSLSAGNPTIRYNRCAVEAAANAFQPIPTSLAGRPFGWFEVVR